MYILGVDFETTGLEESRDVVTEVGAALWEWEEKKPVLVIDDLVSIPEDIKLNPVVVEMTGITGKLLADFGIDLKSALEKLNKIGERAEYIMAHNAEFDKKFYLSSSERAGLKPVLCEKTWLDSSVDVNYPKLIRTRKLGFLAAEHGFLNPFAHRALFDVLTMFKVVQDYDLDKIIRMASEQKYELKANVLYDERQRAREKGFRWNSNIRSWIKTLRESEVKKEAGDCDFEILWRKKDIEKDWKKYGED